MSTSTDFLKIYDDFKVDSTKLCGQYNKIYDIRLKKLRPRLVEKVKNELKMDTKLSTDLKEDDHSVVIGIIYKHMMLQHTALKEIEKKLRMESVEYLENYCSDEDKIFLDDEYLRLELINFPKIHHVVSGTVVAVEGVYTKSGEFIVINVLLPDIPPFLQSYPIVQESNKNILFVSSFNFYQNQDVFAFLQMLVDILEGIIEPDSKYPIDDISCVIISGNIFQYEPPKTPVYSRNRKTLKDENNIISNSLQFDNIIFQLAFKVPVIIMPGLNDPVTHCIPQQPFHKCFFPNSSQHPNIFLSTNPFRCMIDDYEILGTSGQNIKSISQYTHLKDPLEIAQFCLSANLIFPNSPENIESYQFSETDPFIIVSTPRIFFFGSSKEFIHHLQKSETSDDTFLILGIPSFSQDFSAVKVNLGSLETTKINL